MFSGKMWNVVAILVVVALLAGSFATAPAVSAEDPKTKVAFVYVAPIGDLGWTYAHDLGRKMLEEELNVETAYIENVPEGPDAERVIRDYAQKGYDVIFTTSFGYMDQTIAVAEEFPDVYFEHCSGYKTAPNSATYFGRMYQPRFLSGLVAGAETETNKIGFVAAFPIPEVIRGINAFTLGVRAANPEATVHVVWTNTWFGPSQEKEAAEALMAEGCDIIAQHQDTTEPQKAAQEKGLVSIGYDSDMGAIVGDSVLTSPMWDWGPYYVRRVQGVMDGTWETSQYWGSMADGIVKLADFSPKVPDEVKAQVKEYEDKILSSEWDVFTGPINGQGGELAVPDRAQLSDPEMLSMDWFVEGVVGEAPGNSPVWTPNAGTKTMILTAFGYPGDDGKWYGETGPFINAMGPSAERVASDYCEGVWEGTISGQPVVAVTMGVGKVQTTSCMHELLGVYGGDAKEIVWSGISGKTPRVGGMVDESGNFLDGEKVVIGDVCVHWTVVDWDLGFSSYADASWWPLSWPNSSKTAVGSRDLAVKLYEAAQQVQWPEVPEGPRENIALYHGVDGVRKARPFFANCCEVTGDQFWHGVPENWVAMGLVSDQLNAVQATNLTESDVIAFTAMEGTGWWNALEEWIEANNYYIPSASIRSSSNFDHPPLDATGRQTMPAWESIESGMSRGGSAYGSTTAALPILELLGQRQANQ